MAILFQYVYDNENPKDGRDKWNYNFSILSGLTTGLTLTGDYIPLSGAVITGNIASNENIFSIGGNTKVDNEGVLIFIKPDNVFTSSNSSIIRKTALISSPSGTIEGRYLNSSLISTFNGYISGTSLSIGGNGSINYSSILGGRNNSIIGTSIAASAGFSVIVGSESSSLTNAKTSSVISAGSSLLYSCSNSSILGGLSNEGTGANNSIIGGRFNKILSPSSINVSIIGGQNNNTSGSDNVVVASNLCAITANTSAIIGMVGFSGASENTVHVQNLSIHGSVRLNNKSITTSDSPYQITDNEKVIFVNTTSGNVEIILPSNPKSGRNIILKDKLHTFNLNKLILNSNGKQLSIGGASTGVTHFSSSGLCIDIIYDGVEWLPIRITNDSV